MAQTGATRQERVKILERRIRNGLGLVNPSVATQIRK
jgi:hypothetical protein